MHNFEETPVDSFVFLFLPILHSGPVQPSMQTLEPLWSQLKWPTKSSRARQNLLQKGP